MDEASVDTFEDPPHSPPLDECRPEAHLFVVLECDRPTSGGARFALGDAEEIVIGRGEERRAVRSSSGGVQRLRITVPGRSMSALHARIRRVSEGYLIEDAGSTNGSFVNGVPVSRMLLAEDSVIELGHTVFVLRTALLTPRGTLIDQDSTHESPVDSDLATLLPGLARELDTVARIAKSNVPVILFGETGTGKERLARAIHRLSGRSGDFVPVNCAALSPNLTESQLFGHVKGAFSGAVRDAIGFVRSAHRGTLLLDEVGELSPAAQAALLRVLQEHEVVPVGAARAVPVDLRVIAATHRPLEDLVAQQRFRADLFARLDGSRHALPPLRSRREDLGLMLAEALRARSSAPAITPAAGVRLVAHAWPHNVRELVQRLGRALALADSAPLTESHFGLACPTERTSTLPVETTRELSPAEARLKQELLRALERCDGNVSEVARVMGKARMQIQRWMKRFAIDPASYRSPRARHEGEAR